MEPMRAWAVPAQDPFSSPFASLPSFFNLPPPSYEARVTTLEIEAMEAEGDVEGEPATEPGYWRGQTKD